MVEDEIEIIEEALPQCQGPGSQSQLDISELRLLYDDHPAPALPYFYCSRRAGLINTLSKDPRLC